MGLLADIGIHVFYVAYVVKLNSYDNQKYLSKYAHTHINAHSH